MVQVLQASIAVEGELRKVREGEGHFGIFAQFYGFGFKQVREEPESARTHTIDHRLQVKEHFEKYIRDRNMFALAALNNEIGIIKGLYDIIPQLLNKPDFD